MRRWHEKARTGCYTCKQRRIKCDEARPSCKRCLVSRKECPGYQPAPVGNYSWQQLLQHQEPCQQPRLSVDADESRCLSYYHRAVAPSLDQMRNDTFWIIHVPRIVRQEPAARHAVLAISAIHEHFVAKLPSLASSSLDGLTSLGPFRSDAQISSKTAFALRHYNCAIKLVLDDHISDKNVLLTISLLFTCIEIFQGGVEAAAKHCRYGLSIQQKQPLHTELSAAFYQLGFFQCLFDSSSTISFQKSTDLQVSPHLAVGDGIYTLRQAFQKLDAIMAHGIALVRFARPGPDQGAGAHSLQDLKTEQFHICRALSIWWEGFTTLKGLFTTKQIVSDSNDAAFRLLESRWLIVNMLTRSCLAENETNFDEYLREYQRLVEVAQEEKDARDAKGSTLPKFSFDMGYLPLLYLVSLRCRYLRTRLQALLLLKDLSCDREVVWDACFFYASAKFAIQVEHNIVLDEGHLRSAIDCYPDDCLPKDAQRVVGFINTGDASWDMDFDGQRIVRRRICYLVSDSDGRFRPLWDYIIVKTLNNCVK